jgi:hypothetical protein
MSIFVNTHTLVVGNLQIPNIPSLKANVHNLTYTTLLDYVWMAFLSG